MCLFVRIADYFRYILIYKKCNCFVLLSEYETFGIVYREAMASGRPVIAVRNGGVEENWSDAFGILIDKNNYEVILDRKKAIIKGIDLLKNNDILFILGKGHEEYQIINGIKYHFSDKEEVLKYIGR